MNTHKISFGTVCAALIMILLMLAANLYFAPHPVSAEIDSARCTTRTSGKATVGNQASSVIVATTSLAQAGADRAFLRIELPITTGGIATTSIYLSFDEGAAAAVGSGVSLATTSPYVELGLNTSHPYTGAVTAISTSGSTTVLVQECVY